MPDDPIVLPPEDAPQSPSVTINQFIQLVNQNNTFPDASTLNSYSPEDKAWIKSRMEIEQENRHGLMHKLVDHEQTYTKDLIVSRDKARLNSQNWSGVIITLALIGAFWLLYFGKIEAGLGLTALVMIPPIASSIGDHIVKKYFSQKDENPAKTDPPRD